MLLASHCDAECDLLGHGAEARPAPPEMEPPDQPSNLPGGLFVRKGKERSQSNSVAVPGKSLLGLDSLAAQKAKERNENKLTKIEQQLLNGARAVVHRNVCCPLNVSTSPSVSWIWNVMPASLALTEGKTGKSSRLVQISPSPRSNSKESKG